MRVTARRSCLRGLAVMVTVMGVSGGAMAESSDAIGRWLAEQFADEAKRAPSSGKVHDVVPAKPPTEDDERRILEEIEMLERARAEAESHREMIGESKPAGSAEAGAAQVIEERPQNQPLTSKESEPAAQPSGVTDGDRQAQDAEMAQMEAEREAEAERIDAALRRARAAREARNRPPFPSTETTPPGLPVQKPTGDLQEVSGQVSSPSERKQPSLSYVPERNGHAEERDASGRDRSETRVTVLMTMEAGNRGIRRHNKTADPLLCGERGCYVGAGAASPAEFLPRRRAFGPRQALGERAGACRDSLGCVFRGVDLIAYPAVLQPIDMRILRHDRRQPLVLTETSECRIAQGRLACTAFHGPDYTMWIVPERLAELAGAAELTRAVESGLVDSATAAVHRPRD